VTPSVQHICALNFQCQKLVNEGMENVWKRHKAMAEYVREWALSKFDVFCEKPYASDTLTAIRNTRNIDVAKTIAALQEKHNTVFGNGYGKLKQETFRIAHMGDITLNDVKEVTGWIDEEID